MNDVLSDALVLPFLEDPFRKNLINGKILGLVHLKQVLWRAFKSISSESDYKDKI